MAGQSKKFERTCVEIQQEILLIFQVCQEAKSVICRKSNNSDKE